QQVARFAGVLRDQGVVKGDRVVIYMPMIPEAAIAMLACARIGAVHSVIFGGFAANELATRIQDAAPTAIVMSAGGLEPRGPVVYLPILRAALESLVATTGGFSVRSVIVKERRGIPGTAGEQTPIAGESWLDWNEAFAAASDADPVVVAS